MKFKLILSILLLPIVSSTTAMEWESTSEEESNPLVFQGHNLIGNGFDSESSSSMNLAFDSAGPAENETENEPKIGDDSSSDNSEDPDQESAKKAKANGSSITGKKRKKSSTKKRDEDFEPPLRKKSKQTNSEKLARQAASARKRRAEKKMNDKATAIRLNNLRKQSDRQTKELAEKQTLIEQQAQEIATLRYENEQLKQQLSLYQQHEQLLSVSPQIL